MKSSVYTNGRILFTKLDMFWRYLVRSKERYLSENFGVSTNWREMLLYSRGGGIWFCAKLVI